MLEDKELYKELVREIEKTHPCQLARAFIDKCNSVGELIHLLATGEKPQLVPYLNWLINHDTISFHRNEYIENLILNGPAYQKYSYIQQVGGPCLGIDGPVRFPKTQIGIEGEFILLRNGKSVSTKKKGKYMVSHDAFQNLMEIRSGHSHDTDLVANEFRELFAVERYKAFDKLGAVPSFDEYKFSMKVYKKVVGEMVFNNGMVNDILDLDKKHYRSSRDIPDHNKSIYTIDNIYGYPLEERVGDFTYRGGGFHIHISKENDKLIPGTRMFKYWTNPEIKDFIINFEEINHKYLLRDSKNPYRKRGYYRRKPWGFEYRSLPMSREVYDNLNSILSSAKIIAQKY